MDIVIFKMYISQVILIAISNIYCISIVQGINVIYNFENGNYGDLNIKCDHYKESVQEIKLLDTLNVTRPSNGIYAYYSTKGHSCFQTSNIYLGGNVILELEYYMFGGPGEIKITVKEENVIDGNNIFKLFPSKRWTKLHPIFIGIRSSNLYTVIINIINMLHN